MRITEHERDIKDKRTSNAMASHFINTNHMPDFENVTILDQEPNHTKRKISEMIYLWLQGKRS